MRFLTFFLIATVSLFLLISCDNGGDSSIYGETSDYVYEEPDTANDNYQVRPDSSGHDETVVNKDDDIETSDSDVEAPDETIDPTAGMVFIPAGKAWVGCNEKQQDDCPGSELPYHEIITKGFYIDKYEVTVKDFAKCISDGACGEEGSAYDNYSNDNQFCNMNNSKDNHPMNCVSLFAANAYCEWAGKRLPSEAQWEKAARGGCEIHGADKCKNDSFIYTWGNDGDPSCEKINMANDGSDWGCGTDSTATGGSYSASNSPYQCSDMLGNLYEWVADSWSSDHTDAPADGSSRGIPDTEGTIKGGSFMQYEISQFRISFRAKQDTSEILYSRGFRCAVDASE